MWLGCNSKLRICFKSASYARSLILQWRMIFMRVLHKHWLDYDVAALAFLILGIAAVEVLAIIL